MRFMSPPDPWRRFLRDATLHLSAFFPPARKWVDSGKMSVPFVYRDTPLLGPDDEPPSAWNGAPELGAQLPDFPLTVRTEGMDRSTHLRNLLGSGFVVLLFVENKQSVLEYGKLLENEHPSIPLAIYPISRSPLKSGTCIFDADGSLGRLFHAAPDTVLVIRPDRHLALRRHSVDADAIRDHLRSLYRPGG
jgi:3-(3-hydroxy-phenyl)propionate hydroxylase